MFRKMNKHNPNIIFLTSILLLIFSCTREELTGTIYGTVTDFQTGEPIKNVNVKLMPDGAATITGSDGTYSFPDLKPGKYSLCFSKAEYAEINDDYVIELKAGLDFRRDVQMRKRMASLAITDMEGNPLDTLDFGDEESVTTKTFNLFNDGTESLNCSANYECDWIDNISGLEESVEPGQTVPVTVRIDRVALDDGENTTFLYVTTVGHGSYEIVVKATFLGVASITTDEATNITPSSVTIGGNIIDDGGRPVLERGICYGTSQTPDINGDHTQDGSGTGAFSHNITGLSASTTYYARAYATNRNGTYYASNIVCFTTENGLPEVSTTEATDITATTAKTGGNIISNGGYNVTARGVCWNTMGSPDLNDQHIENGNGNGFFTSNLTNLNAGTTYYVRAYATNEIGTVYGNEVSFCTSSGNISISISEPTDVVATSASCSANITDDGGAAVTERGLCWSTSQYPTISNSHVAVGIGMGSYTASMSELNPSTTYYVRAYAINATGTSYSSQVDFTTESGLPTLTTTEVTDITATTAKSGGTITDNGGFNVTERGVCWNTMGNPDLSDPHTTNGTGNGTFISNMTNLMAGTTYHVRAYATNSMGTIYGDEVTFTTSSGAVAMTITEAVNITATSASCSVTINNDGGASITERGICWSTAQYPTTGDASVAIGSGTGTFTASMNNLVPFSTYYVRAYAINASGTSYSDQISFTTLSGLPTISIVTANNITATSAFCSASVSDDGGFDVIERGFCWGHFGNPDISGPHTSNGTGIGQFTSSLADLSSNTTYHVRAYATNSIGTNYGEEVTFTTSSGVVTMTLADATSITASSALCSVTISDDGGASITERGICWSTAQYPTTSDTSVAIGTGLGTFTASMNNLTPSTTYYVRAYTINSIGVCYSNQISFTTNDGLPIVTTGNVSDITANSAICGGDVTSDGGFPVITKGLCWGTSQYPTISESHSNNGSGIGSFNGSLTNLQIGTTYYVRAYATNSVGTVYGDNVSFTTTSGDISIAISTPINITATSASCSANITDDGGATITERGICWSTSQYPTISGFHTSVGNGTGTYTALLSDLTPSTTYYVRAYATNAAGTNYSSQVSFTTISGMPTLITINATDVTATTAKSGGNITDNGGYDVTARGVCWNTMGNPEISDQHSINGNGNGNFTSNLSDLAAGTTYHVRAYATNSMGTSYGNEVTFTTSDGSVTMTISDAINITATSASCSVNISDDGGAAVTERGICWNTSQYPTTSSFHLSVGNGTGEFIASLSELTPATTYYVRAYATNAAGTCYSNQVSFTTTTGLPTITTTNVTDITANTAKSGGIVTDNGGFNVTARGVCWNTMGNPDISDQHTTNGSGNGSFTSNLSGLAAGTTYHVRAYATNNMGTSYGNEVTFTTSSGSVAIAIADATNVTATSASCSVTISDDGDAPITERGICWSVDQYPTTGDFSVATGSGIGTFTASMSSLSPSTTYYVRAYAINSVGTHYSNQISLSTTSGLPSITTKTVTDITATTAKSGGNVIDNGGFNVTSRGICWNTTGNPDTNDQHTTNGSGNGNFTSNMGNLIPGVTYHVRAYATNSMGTRYGNDVTFTTSDGVVSITLSNPTNINANSATCSANITEDGGASVTERGICWGTSQNPTIADSYISAGNGTGSYTASMTDLMPSTTYYVRAYATNAAGTSYSSQKSFTTTDGLPTVTTSEITTANVTSSTFTCGGNVTNMGDAPVTSRGICWSTTGTPTINDSHSTDGSGLGVFTHTVTNVSPLTQTYYVRAYATNQYGTSYGETIVQSHTNPYHLPVVTMGGTTYMIYPQDLGEMNWSTANSTCNNLVAYGFSDWRLPTWDEADDFARTSIRHYFTFGTYYWTSTPVPNTSGAYYTENIYGWQTGSAYASSNYNVRPIRVVVQ